MLFAQGSERPNKDSRKKDEDDKSPKTNRRLVMSQQFFQNLCFVQECIILCEQRVKMLIPISDSIYHSDKRVKRFTITLIKY